MGKLYFYAIFHANLSFSSVPSDQYPAILDKCYWPVLDLVEKGYKLGLEFNTSTLLTINKLDRYFIDEISRLWFEGKCDIIGSAFTQNIFPLIPNEVNKANLKEGKKDYIKLFGRFPEIGFVNEQTYSKGLPEDFYKAGYKAIVMDWDNAAEFNDFPADFRYRPALVKGIGGFAMPIIWNSSLNSYKFQRCVYQRLSIDDFVSTAMSHKHPQENRALPLYGTDWEIFDYRPGTQEEVSGEVCQIEKILKKLVSPHDVELVNPSDILSLLPPVNEVSVESSQCPVPCKNRDDYNVVRWAVTGRDNVYINTECHKMYNKLKNLEFFNGIEYDNNHYWRDLNELWGSDLRTKTTDEKHYYGRLKTGDVSRSIDKELEAVYEYFNPKHDFILINQFLENWDYEPVELDISFNPNEKRGEVYVELDGEPVITQCEYKEYYRDGSLRRVKLVICPFIKSGYAVEGKIICIDKQKNFNFRRYTGDKLKIETESVKLCLASSTGGDIRELVFPKIDKNPLIGYLHPVYYDHIGHSSDYYTGGILVSDSFGKNYNDTVPTTLCLPENIDNYPIRVPVSCKINFGLGICWKKYYVYKNIPRVDLSYSFYFSDLSPIYLRVGVTTINPEAFDKNNLRFACVNGGDSYEEFYTAGKTIQHSSPVGSFTSARACLGATEGWVDISDGNKSLAISTDKSALYSVPMMEYEEVKKSYLMRLYHTISESDETGKVHWRGNTGIGFSFRGHKMDLPNIRTAVNHSSRKLICIQNKQSVIPDIDMGVSSIDYLDKVNCTV